jgi:hypothetical protein
VPPSKGGNHERLTVVGLIVSVLAISQTLREPARF